MMDGQCLCQVWIALLAQGFVNHNGSAVGQIQRAYVLRIADAQAVLRPRLGKFLRQTCGFTAQQKSKCLCAWSLKSCSLKGTSLSRFQSEKTLPFCAYGMGNEGF